MLASETARARSSDERTSSAATRSRHNRSHESIDEHSNERWSLSSYAGSLASQSQVEIRAEAPWDEHSAAASHQLSVLHVPSPSVTLTNLLFNVAATPGGLLRFPS